MFIRGSKSSFGWVSDISIVEIRLQAERPIREFKGRSSVHDHCDQQLDESHKVTAGYCPLSVTLGLVPQLVLHKIYT